MNRAYRPDRAGAGDLMRAHGIGQHLERVARDAQGFAEAISPDAPELRQGYIDSFRTESEVANIARTRRVVVRLVNDADHAAAVESRTHVLSRTKDMIERTYG